LRQRGFKARVAWLTARMTMPGRSLARAARRKYAK